MQLLQADPTRHDPELVRIAVHEAGHVVLRLQQEQSQVQVRWERSTDNAVSTGQYGTDSPAAHPDRWLEVAVAGGAAEAQALHLPDTTPTQRAERVGRGDIGLIADKSKSSEEDARVAAEDAWEPAAKLLGQRPHALDRIATHLYAMRVGYMPYRIPFVAGPRQLELAFNADHLDPITLATHQSGRKGLMTLSANGDEVGNVRFTTDENREAPQPATIDLDHIEVGDLWKGSGLAYLAVDRLVTLRPWAALRVSPHEMNSPEGNSFIERLRHTGHRAHELDCYRAQSACVCGAIK